MKKLIKQKNSFNYLGYLKRYKRNASLGPFFKGLETLTELFVPLIMASIIDVGIKNNDTNYIITYGVLIMALNVVGLIFAIISQKCAASAQVCVGRDIRNDIFSHINNISHAELDKFTTTTLLNRSVNDVRNVQAGVGAILRNILRAPCLLLGSLILSLVIAPKLSTLFIIMIPVIVFIIIRILKRIKPILVTIKTKLDKTTNVTRENLTGIRVVRAFNKQNYETEKFKDSNYDLINYQIKHSAVDSALSPLISIVVNFSILALLYFGGVEVNIGGLSQGKLIAFIDYFGTVSACIVTLSNCFVIINRANASAVRIGELLSVKNSINNSERPIRIKENINYGNVEFKDVSFSYSNVKNALNNLSIKVKAGEIVGIIGGTGSGKSTITNLIPRFYDVSSGEILINGENVKKYDIEQLRNVIGFVPQNPTLFRGTIRSNMCWRKPDATDDEIIMALKIAQAYDFVKEYPDFIEHKVNRGGTNFSGGQRQRLTIARALVGNPDIIILDDASSALDFATDAKLRKAIRTFLSKSTVFIVTQRTNSIKDANKIIVVDNGNIVDIGKHEELLKRCDLYKEIHESQNKKEGV